MICALLPADPLHRHPEAIAGPLQPLEPRLRRCALLRRGRLQGAQGHRGRRAHGCTRRAFPTGRTESGRSRSRSAAEFTNELAVMCDTFRPLHPTRAALELDDSAYPASWRASTSPRPRAPTTAGASRHVNGSAGIARVDRGRRYFRDGSDGVFGPCPGWLPRCLGKMSGAASREQRAASRSWAQAAGPTRGARACTSPIASTASHSRSRPPPMNLRSSRTRAPTPDQDGGRGRAGGLRGRRRPRLSRGSGLSDEGSRPAPGMPSVHPEPRGWGSG